MARGPLYEKGYRPRLTGHQTFPLRYGWLKKAFDAIWESENEDGDNRAVFTGDDAISRFGVGKNMVASMRHWAMVAGVIEDIPSERRIKTTSLGRLIFDDNGTDPYMEDPNTLWLVHWQLAGRPEYKTTWFWAFNYYPGLSFDRDTLIHRVKGYTDEVGWSRASIGTVRRDVQCFLQTYVTQSESRQTSYEDTLESPLIELGLIKRNGNRGSFRFVRGPKPSLGVGVFSYAVTDFWSKRFSTATTLSFEVLAHEPGSPGRAFLLDENKLVEFLERLETASDGAYQWSETAGLKQLIRMREITEEEALDMVNADYLSRNGGRHNDSL